MTAGNAGREPPTTAGLVVRGLAQERRWAIVVLENSVDELLDGRPVGRRALLTPETRDVYWADPFRSGMAGAGSGSSSRSCIAGPVWAASSPSGWRATRWPSGARC